MILKDLLEIFTLALLIGGPLVVGGVAFAHQVNESIESSGGKNSYWLYRKVKYEWTTPLILLGICSGFFNLIVAMATGDSDRTWMESAQWISPLIGWVGLVMTVVWVLTFLPSTIGSIIAAFQKRKRK